MAEGRHEPAAQRTSRRAARQTIAAYHQEQLGLLLEHVRTALAQLDAGLIDEFDVDDVIHHYKHCTAALWKFCGSCGGQWEQAANALACWRERGDAPDWWEAVSTRSN